MPFFTHYRIWNIRRKCAHKKTNETFQLVLKRQIPVLRSSFRLLKPFPPSSYSSSSSFFLFPRTQSFPFPFFNVAFLHILMFHFITARKKKRKREGRRGGGFQIKKEKHFSSFSSLFYSFKSWSKKNSAFFSISPPSNWYFPVSCANLFPFLFHFLCFEG